MTYFAAVISLIAAFCISPLDLKSGRSVYEWTNVTPAASYPQGYNYPVYVFGDWMVALNNGVWLSRDGKKWRKTDLSDSGLNSAYQKYVQFNGAIYALGSLSGNYEKFTVSTKILRTTDFEKWETVSESSNLPQRIFYGLAVFDNKMWLLGGYDGAAYHNDVWNSEDGVRWNRVAEKTAWSPRTISVLTVFKGEMWLLGGGAIDGDTEVNKAGEREVWASGNGKDWRRVEADLNRKWRGTPVVFDGKLMLVGANRGGSFESAIWATENGSKWSEIMAPWSPRGGVAAWVFGGKLYMTGGKSSHTENGEIKFVYSNDVWAMSKVKEG